jgi:hypothetical protein
MAMRHDRLAKANSLVRRGVADSIRATMLGSSGLRLALADHGDELEGQVADSTTTAARGLKVCALWASPIISR